MTREIQYNFCLECGGPLKPIIGSPPRYVCTQCGLTYHLDPKVACAAIIIRDGSILLLKRARGAGKGLWCLPGGFVDRGETLDAAVVREVREETGLETRVRNLHGLYSYDGYTVVVAIYEMVEEAGVLEINPESLDARWFAPREIPWDDLAFPSATDALKSRFGGASNRG